jgi:hypothetical protein
MCVTFVDEIKIYKMFNFDLIKDVAKRVDALRRHL